jgi:hypothetical protein
VSDVWLDAETRIAGGGASGEEVVGDDVVGGKEWVSGPREALEVRGVSVSSGGGRVLDIKPSSSLIVAKRASKGGGRVVRPSSSSITAKRAPAKTRGRSC